MSKCIDCCKYCHAPIKIMHSPYFSKKYNRSFCNIKCYKKLNEERKAIGKIKIKKR